MRFSPAMLHTYMCERERASASDVMVSVLFCITTTITIQSTVLDQVLSFRRNEVLDTTNRMRYTVPYYVPQTYLPQYRG